MPCRLTLLSSGQSPAGFATWRLPLIANVRPYKPHLVVFKQIYSHLIAPKLALAAASAAAGELGLKTFEVVGSNMAPTLEPKEIAWYAPVSRLTELRRGFVVALSSPVFGTAIVPSRIASFPGETVEIREGMVLINGEVVAEPYLDPRRAEQEYSLTSEPFVVPSGHVWLLGDFRDMSKDSRSIGPVPSNAVLGRITHAHPPGSHARPRQVE